MMTSIRPKPAKQGTHIVPAVNRAGMATLALILTAAASIAVSAPKDANPMVMAHQLTTTGSQEYLVISKGGDAGPYQAFPDAARLGNGDIVATFYSGYGHVSLSKPGWEKGGRICMVRSSDEGSTWTRPQIIYDDGNDNRDPHIAQFSDGTMICSFFSLSLIPGTKERQSSGTEIITSRDNGRTWDSQSRVIAANWYVSAPVRQLKDGTCLLGLYRTDPDTKEHLAAVIISKDSGQNWSEPRVIGAGQNLPIDAETDVIELKDGRILAALRANTENMYQAFSTDGGETWGPATELGFRIHSPHLNRLSTGEIILAHRLPDTAMHISTDEAATWAGPYLVDNVHGAYPATVELKDKTVLIIYYTEGKGSEVRAKRFRLTSEGPEFLPLNAPPS